MTITVCILVPTGIVLAADSRQLTQSVRGHWRVDSDNANKIFQLGPHLTASVYGQGTYYFSETESPQSIGSILHSVASQFTDDITVSEAASRIYQRVTNEFNRHRDVTGTEQEGSVGFYVAGYSPGESIGELYRCEFPGKVTLERKTNDAGAVWNGQREIVDRLILGYDPRLFGFLNRSETHIELTDAKWRQKLQLHINFQTMPLQDAVDLAVLLVHTTIKLEQLSDGIIGAPGQIPACGGDIDVAVITPEEGFRWLQRKQLKV